MLDGEELHVLPDRFVGDFGSVNTKSGYEKSIIVTRLISDFVQLKGRLEVKLKIDHHFTVTHPKNFECSDGMPEFTTAQRLPFLGAAVAGAGLLVWGGVMEHNASKDFDEAKTMFSKNEELEGQRMAQEAKSNHQTAVALMAAGGVIVVADAIWYFAKRSDYRKRKEVFTKYCPEGRTIGFSPSFEMPSQVAPNGIAGLSIVYNF